MSSEVLNDTQQDCSDQQSYGRDQDRIAKQSIHKILEQKPNDQSRDGRYDDQPTNQRVVSRKWVLIPNPPKESPHNGQQILSEEKEHCQNGTQLNNDIERKHSAI